MAWFVKHETFTAEMAALSVEQRRSHLDAHRQWVQQEKDKGRTIHSGFLVDENRLPGGGGLLVFVANNFQEALNWVQTDPMIRHGLVDWSISEWIVDCEETFITRSTDFNRCN
ncbi:YciI family protein [Synechococcus sp. ROS8604]|uniref:YciI family protein n=1 Tax=Synechococcus sp. ROS8604 TaxID=1442557 RepID=UPI001645CD2D|nr:YciI family protein [Synechococcus sp. ROS8604]QNI86903.1 YCII-like domain protein [Synechococcus sp. ROS8604]